MKTYSGGQTVDPGLFFNLRELSFTSVDDIGPLPGRESDRYRRVPTLLMLVVGPVLGLVYAIFLPLLGFGMATWFVGVKVAHAAAGPAGALVRVLRPGWEPALAFLSRARSEKTEAARPDTWAEDVRKRVEPTDEDTA